MNVVGEHQAKKLVSLSSMKAKELSGLFKKFLRLVMGYLGDTNN